MITTTANELKQLTSEKQFGLFLTTLFQPNDLIEFRLFHHTDKSLDAIRYFRKAGEAGKLFSTLALANREDGREVYAGVNPRKRHGGKREDVALARCLFCEWDNVDAVQFAALLAVAKLPTPTLAIFSGHGLHAYWMLNTPIDDLELFEAIQAKLITLAKSDPVIKDAPRVMRAPGLMNLGDPAKDETPIACQIIHAADVRYDYQDITRLVLKPTKPAPAPPRVADAAGMRSQLSCRTKDYLATTSLNGSRNKDLFDAACDLYGNGLTEAQIGERLIPCGRRDGLGDDEIKTTIKSACGKPRSPAKPLSSPSTSKRAPWPVLDDDAMYGLAGDIARAGDPNTEAANTRPDAPRGLPWEWNSWWQVASELNQEEWARQLASEIRRDRARWVTGCVLPVWSRRRGWITSWNVVTHENEPGPRL